jgi:sigma-B regulation protein RsbU (phosphoserine phosphatase)
MSLMPKEHPTVKGFDIAGMSVPALDVGGDLFDYAPLGGGNKFAISVFDVSGKGMQAAMSAVFTSGAFASEARLSDSPAEILTRLNRAVCAHARKGHFVAFLLAVIDPASRSVTFANAGQTKPLLRSGGCARWLDGVGIHFPLGMKNDSLYQERTMTLSPGDRLFLLTDGFTDAMNSSREMFGFDQMEKLVCKEEIASMDAARTLAFLTEQINRHTSGAPQHDDMTMVVACAL